MNSPNDLTVPKWPFFLADGVLVAAAGLALWFSSRPPGPGTVVAVVLLLLLGAIVCLIPYLVEAYWNGQQAAAVREEQLDLQRQALAKTGEQIAEVVRRWEEASSSGSQGGSDLKEQIEETARGFQQWQDRLEKREARFAEELGALLQQDREQRGKDSDRLDRTWKKLEALAGKIEHSIREAGNGHSAPRPAAPAEPPLPAPAAPAEPSPAPSEAAELSGEMPAAVKEEAIEVAKEKPAAVVKERKAAKPRVREETGASLFSSTTLVATAFIGASNKLFLRGDGPGLKWDEGIPMQFVEIGKWSWTTTEAVGPIRLRVFKNDEEEDKAGVLTLEPGQRLDIRPDFDG